MKYNVGDKVRIKSIDWYNKNKNEKGYIYFNNNSFVSDMSEFCGKIATIIKKCDKYYKLDIDKNKGSWSWTDDMLEDMVETKRIKNRDEGQGTRDKGQACPKAGWVIVLPMKVIEQLI